MGHEIQEGDVVELDCTGSLENGLIFLSLSEDGPLKLRVGQSDFIKGLDKAVLGMKKGQSKKVEIEPQDGFGDYDKGLLVTCPLNKLPSNAQKGMQLKSSTPDGQSLVWIIREIDQEKNVAVLDGNHILAGKKLYFDISVIEISQIKN